MNINYEKNQIIVYGKGLKYDAFIKKLSSLSGEQIYSFFNSRGIALPRMMNVLALTSVCNNKIKFLNSNSLTKDYFTRLQHYKNFTETQLENLFIATNGTSEDFEQYRYNLCKLIIDNFQELDINDGEIMYLKNLKKAKIKSFEEYVGYISACSLEQPGTFDGASIEGLKKDLMFTATNQEILLIGDKYGITIPERLSKEEYLDFIKTYLNMLGRLNAGVEEQIDNMTLQALSIYCKQNGIPMQPAMSKDDLVTYLFYYLDQCEIPYSSVESITYDPTVYGPLDFTVDLSVIPLFGDGVAKKIIHYEGEEADSEEFERQLDLINNPVENQEEPIGITDEDLEEEPESEPITDAEKQIDRPLRFGETKASFDEEKRAKAEALEIEEAKKREAEEAEKIMKELEAKRLEEERIKKEQSIPLATKLGVDVKKSEPNDQYGSNKIKNLGKSNTAKIAWSTVGALLLCAVGVLVWAMFFR